MRNAILVLLALSLSVLLTAGLNGIQAESEDQAAEIPEPIPASAKALKNPEPGSKESAARGEVLFSSQCAMCHGKDGAGQGNLVERLKLTMPKLNDGSVQKSWTDGELFWVLSNGHGRMPKQEQFDDSTRWDLVNYVRTLPSGS